MIIFKFTNHFSKDFKIILEPTAESFILKKMDTFELACVDEKQNIFEYDFVEQGLVIWIENNSLLYFKINNIEI